MKKGLHSALSKRAYIYLAIIVIIITIGYFIMSFGDIVLSPIILIIAYVVAIPVTLLLPENNKKKE